MWKVARPWVLLALSLPFAARALQRAARRPPLPLHALEVQTPWSRKILSGEKTIETRGYPLPEHLVGRPLAIIETDGEDGVSPLEDVVPPGGARLVGTVTFNAVRAYESREAWDADRALHLVEAGSRYGWAGRPIYGWVVGEARAGAAEFPGATRVMRSVFRLKGRWGGQGRQAH